MMKIIKTTVIILFCVIFVVGLAVGQGTSLTTKTSLLTDGFEDGDIAEYDNNDPSGWTTDVISTTSSNGTYSFRYEPTNSDTIRIESNQSGFNLQPKESFNITVWQRMWNDGLLQGETDGQFNRFSIVEPSSGKSILYSFNSPNGCCGGEYRWIIRGNLVENANGPSNTDKFAPDTWFKTTFEMDYENNKARLYIDGDLLMTTNITDSWTNGTDLVVRMGYSATRLINTEGPHYFYFDNVTVEGSGKDIITLEFRNTNSFMNIGEKQKYEVYEVTKNSKTNKITDEKEITNQANVSSNNTTVLNIYKSNKTIVASDNKTIDDYANVTAKNNSISTNFTILVTTQTLDNIEEMPNTRWLNAFVGIHETGLQYGLGSEIQWIFFIILMMVTTTHITQSKWIGLGTGEILLILFWLTEFIGLGVFLGSMIFGIFMILTQMGRNDQNVTIQQPPNNDF